MGPSIRLASFLLCAAAVGAVEGGAAPADRSERALIREALAAAGISDPLERTLAQARVEHELQHIASQVEGPPRIGRARRLHGLLHRDYLREYRVDADDLLSLVADGRFNCVSATLLYGLVGRRLGFEVVVLERPGHLRLRLRTGARAVDIETTVPTGFAAPGASSPSAAGGLGEDGAVSLPTTSLPASSAPEYRELPLDATVGFAWLNRAWRALDAGRALGAAEHAAEAARFLPAADTERDVLRRVFAQAFRLPYERGGFDEAFRIAVLELEALPAVTTARDRLVASAAKLVEETSEADDPARAEGILDEALTALPGSADARRLVRSVAPMVAAAAVRLGDGVRARRAAFRYAVAEPDGVEAARFLAWVRSRIDGDVPDEPWGEMPRAQDRPPWPSDIAPPAASRMTQ